MKIADDLLTVNPYSRPGKKLIEVASVVLHWVANPGTSPKANRDYFESRKNGKLGYGSAHYIIGIDGSILRCIPDNEMAYHVGAKTYTKFATEHFGPYPNNCTIGIELCHPEWDGVFTDETLESAHELCASLLREHELTTTDIVRHFDITGKDCPKYFVAHPEELAEFRTVVRGLI